MKRNLPAACILSILLSCSVASAADPLPKTAEKWDVAGHTAMLYAPPKPAAGRPWVWFAPSIKGVSLAIRPAYFEGFLNAGIGIAGFDLGEVRGAPASNAEFTKFYEDMVRRGWSAKPILIGQSRGGLMMLSWAAANPDKPQAFVGIYPVCNLAQWAMKNLEPTLADYRLTEEELRARMKEFNPLDRLDGLAKRKLPMFVVHGDADLSVPYDENTKLLKERYEAMEGPITVKIAVGEGHKATPAFFECPELIAFVLSHAKLAAAK